MGILLTVLLGIGCIHHLVESNRPETPRPVTVVLMNTAEYETSDAPAIDHFEWKMPDGMIYSVRPGEVISVTANTFQVIGADPVYSDGKDYGNGCRCGWGMEVYAPPETNIAYLVLEYKWDQHGNSRYRTVEFETWQLANQDHFPFMAQQHLWPQMQQ